MTNQVHPCLWFDGKAKAAADFYCSIFNNTKILADTPIVVTFELEGQKFMGLNGGPKFQFNPSVSFFVTCDSDEEIKILWEKLSTGGTVMMPLGTYPWSSNYGWLSDQFGVSWQLMKGTEGNTGKTISPAFLFVGEQYGNAEAAIKHYTNIFPDSGIQHIQLYGANEPQPEGRLKHGQFTINNTVFMAMDGLGEHKFSFNEAVSFVVECDTQQEIDFFWNRLTEGGEESMCGWLKDKFGVSWQIVPTILGKLMTDPEKSPRVMAAFLKMKKFDIAQLLEA
jgi:predicted 3-demethylubiquinone-9 3-methyltransferase (glyoxalase superfamily)